MKREKAIESLASVAETIFWAEETIAMEWYKRLKEAPSLPKDEQHQLVKEYSRAVAVAIVDKLSDEQLEKLL